MKKENIAKKFIRKLLTNLLHQWKKAWLYRVNNANIHKVKTQIQDQNKESKQKLKYIHENIKYLGKDEKLFLLKDLPEHLTKSSKQIKTWIGIHLKSMKIQYKSIE
jgi:small-conductance mechanosensitive channel